MWEKVSRELLQETHVALKEKLDVVDAVLHERNTVGAHAESEAADFLGIVTVFAHALEDIGIDHAAAQQFDPPAMFTGATTFRAANDTAHQHLGAGLGEGEERGAETGLHA